MTFNSLPRTTTEIVEYRRPDLIDKIRSLAERTYRWLVQR